MKAKLLFLVSLKCLFYVLNCGSLSFPMETSHTTSMHKLSHSKHYFGLVKEKHLRHTLEQTYPKHALRKQYLQSNLFTDGSAFKIVLNVSGLEYKVSIDTGSADLVIKGEKTNGQPKQKYICNKTCGRQDRKYTLGYLDGFMACYTAVIPVQFAQIKLDVPMLVAYRAAQKFDNIQGICGVSYPSLAVHRPTFIQTLIKQKVVYKYAYGVNFNFFQANRSFISFGQSDPDLYQGKLALYSIISPGMIMTNFKWVKIGNSKIMTMSTALLDTGNTCISIDKRYEKDIISAFQNDDTVNRCYFYDQPLVPMFRLFICRVLDFQQLPDLQIVFDKIVYRVSKQYYLQYCLSHNNINYCVTYIQSVIMDDHIIIGDGFFSRFYTYFNLEDQKVGIARNRENVTLDDMLSQPPQDVYLQQDWAPLNY